MISIANTAHLPSTNDNQQKSLAEERLMQSADITVPPSLLLEMMHNYGLKASDVIGDYVIDLDNIAKKTQPLTQMQCLIKNWPSQMSWAIFNQYINQLLQAWQDDYHAGAPFDAAFFITQSITLKSVTLQTNLSYEPLSISARFHHLLMHLIARTTQLINSYKLNFSQHYDLNTGLPNQTHLFSTLNATLNGLPQQEAYSAISTTALTSGSDGIGLIVLHFKIKHQMKSPFHYLDNEMILAATLHIKQHLNQEVSLFYVGHCELAILIHQLRFTAQLNLIAETLLSAFEAALIVSETPVVFQPFFGCSYHFQSNEPWSFDGEVLFDQAKLALHHAMNQHQPIQIYEQHIKELLANNHILDDAIIKALHQNALDVFLQPIINLQPNIHCNSAELLLRWESSQWPNISPVRLIETIYSKGFGRVFIRWLINIACRYCSELSCTLQRNFTFTINLNAQDLLETDLINLLAQSLQLWQTPAENITVEITESDIFLDEEKIKQVLNGIVALGCKLAIDDFGTGYSSMARLRHLPIDIVKIDQSFIRNITTSSQDKAIVASMIEVSHQLEKEVVAEGVEDLSCLNTLKTMQCNKIQGYFYAKPMPFDTFSTWIKIFENNSHINN
ncbi:MAG: GGDEF domain-containing protein [Methylotenera sp.]|nr:GGDEF domain-containing protein [Methylotenera sp.]